MEKTASGFWGKLSKDHSQQLALADHCIDVASVFRALCDLPAIQRSLGLGCDATVMDRLAVFAYLHDMGKCNTGFQAKRDPDARDIAGHVKETAALLYDAALRPRLIKALDLEEMCSWFDNPEADLPRMLLASIFHHGKPAFKENIEESDELNGLKRHWLPRGGIDPFDGLRELGRTVRLAFPAAFSVHAPPIKVTTDLEHRFAGLVMLADWLGSHRESFFPFEHEGVRIEWSRQQAKKALVAVGLDIAAARTKVVHEQPTFGDTFGIQGEPRPLQLALACADLPALLVAESDTGSGKTEAALMHFLALFAAGKVDGLYFALPTRVAARELYGRVIKAMSRVFGDECPPVLLAVPDYTQIDGEPMNMLPSDTHLFNDDEQKTRDRGWTAERPKRFLAAPIAVGTIDQALSSAIQVPHAHLRAACLDRSLLVIDEVHSSDVYMRYLARRLLNRHLKAGGHALLLSATLGAAARAEYLHPGDSLPQAEPFDQAVALPYPALSAPNTPMRHLPDPAGRSKTVRFDPLPLLKSPEDLLPRMREAVRLGQRVLVILNTVSRAVALARLADADPELASALFAVNGVRAPHHGRFARADREQMDRAVSNCMGRGRESPAGAMLLIGTQTLEQSLDIDADWLVTDLCPVDVLLQRIGRLHRHDRGPRAMPVCTVLLPEEPDFSVFLNPKGEVRHGNLAGLGSVYEDLRILQLTRNLVAAGPVIEIPRDNRHLVEAATHPERLKQLQGDAWNLQGDAWNLQGNAWKNHGLHVEGVDVAQQFSAHSAVIPNEHFGEFMFSNAIGERLSTRLGLSDRTLLLGGAHLSPFGQTITEINISGHLAPKQEIEQAYRVIRDDDGLLIHADRAGQYVYRYSRFGLEKTDR